MTAQLNTRPLPMREELMRQRDELVARGREERDAIRDEGEAGRDVVVDEAEASALDLQTELECALLEIRTEAIRNIDNALARIDAGIYGICEHCGDDIDLVRLRALPFADRCVSCATRTEQAAIGRRSQAYGRLASLPLETGDDASA